MLSTKDVQKLIEAMKGVFYTKDDLDKRFDFIAEKFEGVDKRFDGMDKKLNTVELKVSELAEGLEDLSGKVEILDDKVINIQTSLDAIVLDNKNSNQSRTVLSHRVEKLENWTQKAASAIGVKFEN